MPTRTRSRKNRKNSHESNTSFQSSRSGHSKKSAKENSSSPAKKTNVADFLDHESPVSPIVEKREQLDAIFNEMITDAMSCDSERDMNTILIDQVVTAALDAVSLSPKKTTSRKHAYPLSEVESRFIDLNQRLLTLDTKSGDAWTVGVGMMAKLYERIARKKKDSSQ